MTEVIALPMHCIHSIAFKAFLLIKQCEVNKFVMQSMDTAVIDEGDSFSAITEQNGNMHSYRHRCSVFSDDEYTNPCTLIEIYTNDH